MQVSSQNSLSWLQTAPDVSAMANQTSSAYGQISPGDGGSTGGSNTAGISALQSAAQMFAPASLNTLISAQADPNPSGTASSATPSTPSTHHHHHRHGGALQTSAADGVATTSADQMAMTAGSTAADTDGSTQADLEDVLVNL